MTIFQAIVYGIVQGLTEFLPVSSSAHLILVPTFTGWEDPGLAFDVALHWGTLIAVTGYFWHDILTMLVGAVGYLQGRRSPDNTIPWKIAVATVPAAIIGFLIEHAAETTLRSPWIIVCTLSVMGILLGVADRVGSKSVKLESAGWGKVLGVGFCQAFALIPGVSRSGVTITASLFAGLDRAAAVRLSFLLSIPIIAGAGILKAKYIIHNAGDPSIWVGIIASAVSGMLAIHVLISYVRSKSFKPFVIYRITLAVFLAAYLISRHQ